MVGSRNVAFARISASLVALDPERGMMLLLGAWNRIWILALIVSCSWSGLKDVIVCRLSWPDF